MPVSLTCVTSKLLSGHALKVDLVDSANNIESSKDLPLLGACIVFDANILY